MQVTAAAIPHLSQASPLMAAMRRRAERRKFSCTRSWCFMPSPPLVLFLGLGVVPGKWLCMQPFRDLDELRFRGRITRPIDPREKPESGGRIGHSSNAMESMTRWTCPVLMIEKERLGKPGRGEGLHSLLSRARWCPSRRRSPDF